MKRQTLALVFSTLLIVTSLPWLAYSQIGGSDGSERTLSNLGGQGMDGMEVPREKIIYHRPAGPPPSWLTHGIASVKSSENLRDQLNNLVRIEKPHERLSGLATTLQELGNEIQVEFDLQRIDEEGISFEECRGLLAGEGPLRDLLMRTLDQQGLAYRVLDHHIQVTTKDAANANPTIRYYDLAYVQTDNSLLEGIMNAITRSVDPENWINNGGEGNLAAIGQLLVVRTTEASHLEIEKMLARLSLTTNAAQENTDLMQPFGRNPKTAPTPTKGSDPFGASEGQSRPERPEDNPFGT